MVRASAQASQIFDHQQLGALRDRDGPMLACRARRNEQPVPLFERDDLAIEADAESAFQHVADVPGLAPVRSSVAGLELDEAKLPRALAVNLLTDIGADLLPCIDRNKLQFELANRATVVLEGGDYGDDYVVGPAEWPLAVEQGRVQVPYSLWLSSRVWATP